MNDPSSYGYQEGGPVDLHQPPARINPAQYRFSQDELRVLAECNRESFIQRSLPLGIGLGFGTYTAVQAGHLKPNARFGAVPKVSLAVIVGYFLGKLSYQQACAEKLMALPGSYIGQLLRDRKDGKTGGTSLQNQTPTMFGAGPGDIYSDAGPGSSLNLDTDRPLFNDDTYRPSYTDSANTPPQESTPARPNLSYEDLRRKNRTEYSETKQDPYRVDPNTTPVISRPRPPPSSPPPATNKYGDVVE
ncbi:OCIA domain-containing protein 1-like [Galleria mellonella]|uniref:OCIA domain-containing protein 1-like n=1 Tax=Galleria mellonella TaxID=7137 RepID=A0A6J1WWF6_GALME|nr:OCIA domain-containing protein 1-like [Galleria mellonella]